MSPRDSEEVWATLRNGVEVCCRPLRPTDRETLRDGFARLSPRSRYLRFHAAIDHLTEAQLDHLTDVDGHDHVAWVAFATDDEGDERGVGVARYIRLVDEPEVAEAAVTVVDSHQGLGLGTLLLGLIVRSARANGVERFRSYVLAENVDMLALFDQLGADRVLEDDGVWRVDLPVPATADRIAESPAGRVLRRVARSRERLGFRLLGRRSGDLGAWLADLFSADDIRLDRPPSER